MSVLKITFHNQSKIELSTPILMGYRGINLKSKIGDYCKTAGMGGVIKSEHPVALKLVDLQEKLATAKGQEKKDLEYQVKLLSMQNMDLLIALSDSQGNADLMFQIIDELIAIYKLDPEIKDSFTNSEFKQILIYILSEPINDLKSFLAYIQDSRLMVQP